MNSPHSSDVERVFEGALACDESQRDAFVRDACGNDVPLHREVVSLLHADAEEGLLDLNIGRLAAEVFALRDEPGVRDELVGPYRLVRHLGAGGMGDVYLARDTRLDRDLALKILVSAGVHDGERMRRFGQEARAASALNHPNIVTVYDIGHADGKVFIATEFVNGETLRRRMDAPIAPKVAVQIARQILGALDATHRAGIVHRDVKPENVMVRADGVVKILDFGLAKLPQNEAPSSISTDTVPGVVFGTTPYMSPEQAQGLPVDPRSDIFSVGVVLFEMITGRLPFHGATSAATIASILRDQPPRMGGLTSDVPADLERIIARALCKDRTARYQRAEDVLTDLAELLETWDRKVGRHWVRGRILRQKGAVTIAALTVVGGLVALAAMSNRGAADLAAIGVAASEPMPAHQLYLKGRYFWNKRTVSSIEMGIEYFQQAATLNPQYALAYSGLADSYLSLGGNQGAPRPSRDYHVKAKESAEKALALDPNLAQAHVTLASVLHFHDWDWQGAEREFKRAIELDPRLAEAHQRYGMYLAFMRRFDEAREKLRRAEELDPVSLAISTDVAVVENFTRRPDRAIAQLRKALEIDPTYDRARFELAAAYALQGQYATAAGELDESKITATSPNGRVAVDRTYALAGQPTKTRQLLTDLIEESKRQYVPPTAIAELHAALGDNDAAFQWLELAFTQRSLLLLRVFVDPRWERYSMSADPRFVALRRRIGLPFS